MSEQREVTIQLPDELGDAVDTIQIEGSGTGEGDVAFFATIYGSDEAGYLGIVESSHAQPSIAEAIKQDLIQAPIDWEDIRINWANEHTGLGVFDTLEEARSRIRELRSDPPTWRAFK
ncbi:hypothetical protein KFU94_63790 [Chloroflexi bacterium TSY]|nr:hypothetical protein [Chloroflexi bacterium TSY]